MLHEQEGHATFEIDDPAPDLWAFLERCRVRAIQAFELLFVAVCVGAVVYALAVYLGYVR
jgi:hypothetical protein